MMIRNSTLLVIGLIISLVHAASFTLGGILGSVDSYPLDLSFTLDSIQTISWSGDNLTSFPIELCNLDKPSKTRNNSFISCEAIQKFNETGKERPGVEGTYMSTTWRVGYYGLEHNTTDNFAIRIEYDFRKNPVFSRKFLIMDPKATTTASFTTTSSTPTSTSWSGGGTNPVPTGAQIEGGQGMSNSMGGGAIAGIVVGALIGMVLLFILACYLLRRKRRKARDDADRQPPPGGFGYRDDGGDKIVLGFGEMDNLKRISEIGGKPVHGTGYLDEPEPVVRHELDAGVTGVDLRSVSNSPRPPTELLA